MLISKVAKGQDTELSGVKLALYRADESGALVREDRYLVETWITGTDGSYTDKDFVNGLIPDGYEKGDLRPHSIFALPDGAYYVVELEVPDYYTLMEPLYFEYRGGEEIRLIRAENVTAKGELEITKTDEEGEKLSGVTFELTAYVEGDMRNPVEGFPITLSDYAGIVRKKDLPVGKMNEDGSITPYVYKLKELTPPEGYQADTRIITFRFPADHNGASYEFGQNAFFAETIVNEETSFFFEKHFLEHLDTDETEGAFVEGAVLAVYELLGTDENGNFVYEEEDEIARWTTKENERHELRGLVAGKSYILVELKAPQGVNLIDPVIFTISADGRGIYNISNRSSVVTANYINMGENELDTDNFDTDSIHSVTVRGRFAAKVEYLLADEQGTEIARWTASDGEYTLYEADGLEDGAVYTLEEHTLYSDGEDIVTGKTTRRIHFAEGAYTVPTREVHHVELKLTDEDGLLIYEFNPNEFVLEKTIENNVMPENPKVLLRNRNKADGDPIEAGREILSTIAYVNPSSAAADVIITAELSEGMEILDPYSGIVDGKKLSWRIENVAPGSGGYVSFVGELGKKAEKEVSVKAAVQVSGKDYKTTKTVPVLQKNQLIVSNVLTGSGKEIYKEEETKFKVRLYSSSGEELRGTYSYTGSREGELRSGDVVTLKGNEYIVIDPSNFYKNARYEIERIDDGSNKKYIERRMSGIVDEETGAAAVAVRNVKDTSERELFRKGGEYYLTETTAYSDGGSRISSRFKFILSDKADIEGIGGYDEETHVVIEKTDITDGKALPGNEMAVLDSETGHVVERWISSGQPHEMIAVLTPGREYILREIRPADGYGYAEDIIFTVNTDGSIDTVIMENRPTEVVIEKTDKTDGKLIPDAMLEIRSLDDEVVVPAWTSGQEAKRITGLLIADETYKLVELTAPDGFVKAKEVYFTVSHDGSPVSVKMEDDTTKLRIFKNAVIPSPATPSEAVTAEAGPESGRHLAGAILQILNEDKTPAKAANDFGIFKKGDDLVFETTDTFIELVKQLAAGKTYWLHEIRPADGYAYADDVKFAVGEDGDWTVVEMKDEPTKVEISKQAITGADELPGATLSILDQAGTVIETWVSGEEPHMIMARLNACETYILREVSTIPGYAYAEEIRFSVSRDGSIDRVVMKNKPTKVEIHKLDGNSNRLLGGAEFKLVDAGGNTVIEKIVTEDGIPFEIKGVLEAGKSYTLIETKAPSGDYKKAPNVTFTVSMDGSVDEILVRNYRGSSPGEGNSELKPQKPHIVINKYDGVSFQALPGAVIEIRYEDGTVFAQAETDSQGRAVFPMPPAGNFVYEEVKAPEGYLRNTEIIPFTVKDDIPIGIKGLPNYQAPSVTVEKIGTTRLNPVSGAKLAIYAEDGTHLTTGVTDRNGFLTFIPKEPGRYYVLEAEAPDGYVLNETPIWFTVSETGAVEGCTILYDDEEDTDSPKKKGVVTAIYNPDRFGNGNASVGDKGRGRDLVEILKTGDNAPIAILLLTLVFGAALLGGGVLAERRRRNGK